MDPGGLLGAVANEIRGLHESADPAAGPHLRGWREAFPIVRNPLLARMRAARAQRGFEDERREFARAQARRRNPVENFGRALREGSVADRVRWSWAVRGYARDVVRFLDTLELQRRLPARASGKAGRESGWWPLRPLQDAAVAPYRERLLPPAAPPDVAAHSADRERAWVAARGSAAKEFRRSVASRDALLAEATRLAKRTRQPLPEMPSEFGEQLSVLRQWLRETHWTGPAVQSRAESSRLRTALASFPAALKTPVAEAARWLISRNDRRDG
jgi:hypothetical protein